MASERQIAANRRNALRSTGPRTAAGKRRSRRNACRHGLTAETVIASLEQVADYHALEAGLFTDFAPVTVLERQLVARLASLLWRLRRATLIETGLYESNSPREVGLPEGATSSLAVFYQILNTAEQRPPSVPLVPLQTAEQAGVASAPPARAHAMQMASAHLRLYRQSPSAIKRLTRYETALWRQVAQTLLMLGRPPSFRLRNSTL